MRDAVRARWIEFTEPLEGGVPWLYADVRGLITIAFGNLVDPLGSALTLPLMHPGGVRATKNEITVAWLTVKGNALAATHGHLYARSLTTLRLTREGMSDLALAKLEANDAILRGRIDGWEELPACAQMAIHSLAWACGPMFNFPKLIAAVNAGDFDVAVAHITMNETTPEGVFNAGLVARNIHNRVLMRNAARVQAFHLDPDLLNWSHDLSVADASTLHEIPVLNTPLPLVNTPIVDCTASQPTTYPHADPVYNDIDRDPDDAV